MASSSSPIRVINYDVFLSFRGEDTRNNIVSYLYEALSREGIFTFRDDKRLQASEKISDQLVDAIKTSRFAVVVISKNYATSKWCLDELQLIMELQRKNQIRVVPIFDGVEPSDVRRQTGSFAASFQRYENLYTAPEMVSQWKRALNQVGHMSGFHSRTSLNEAAMISNIVRSVSSQLMKMRPTSGVDLVGMEAHMVKMHFLLNMESENEVLMIGICGMGGVGKTTIAKCLYDRFSRQFSAHYFTEDIKKNYKDKGLSYLQERFLCSILRGQHFSFRSDEEGSLEIQARLRHQKVFVVLDGVDEAKQMHALAKETSWFGPGSRIIITTRDWGLLNSCGVNIVHEVKCLDDKDSLQVFEKLAFGGRPPPSDGFEQLYIRASRLAHGLPSALVAYASYLSENKTINMWEAELRKLERRSHKNVEKILRYSYSDLDDQDKAAFLLVACLFNRYPFSHVASFLDDGLPRINHLINKSIISISADGCINMHFLVVQTGRAIVRQDSPNRPFRQRFLWDPAEIYDILEHNIGTDETEGVTLHMCEMPDTLRVSNEVFNVMKNIKFLKFFQHLGDAESNVQLRQGAFNFPPYLRLLHWDAYPFKTLPSIQYRHLVELDLRYSNLERLWDKTMNLSNLRRLDVTGSKNLIELPDFSSAMNFEELIVKGCIKLRQMPESLEHISFSPKKQNHDEMVMTEQTHRNMVMTEHGIQTSTLPSDSCSLQSLNIKNFRYKEFRYKEMNAAFRCNSFELIRSLTELKLVNLNIQNIPGNIDCLVTLETLDLSGNDFAYLPTSIGQLPKLKYLSLRNCRKITSLPHLTQVETLILSDCVNLRWLLFEDRQATNWLLELSLDNCKKVQTLSGKLSHFPRLTYLDLSKHDFETIPASIRELSSLGTLCLNKCKKLISVEELPLSIKHLYAHGCDSLENVSLSPNHSIKHLDLLHCPRLNRQEHEHLMNLFLSNRDSKEVSSLQIDLVYGDVFAYRKLECPADLITNSQGHVRGSANF
ncbi:unnamed protein product [Arabis nemorensis]|uniref:TIR domain-containing protein n=1 Tax=Arabis nemorensis TaxID=586526 RepID=A0A565B093_9BRAS|nr:unnamed protein product [Arabis nemorensis]